MKTGRMRQAIILICIAVFIGLIGFVIGQKVSAARNPAHMDRVITVKWGGGKYGPAFYGAVVFLEPEKTGFAVHARVYVGRGNKHYHDCGVLGHVKTDQEAVALWGRIDWQEDGMHIGADGHHFFLPRSEIEGHR